MSIIDDGTGKGYQAKVNANNRLYTSSVSRSEEKAATDLGRSYTIASGMVTLTSAGESGVLYIKNNETCDLHMRQAIISFSPSTGGSSTDTNHVRVYRNPTTGTLISSATTGPIACNRNFGSSNTLTADMYIGAEGETVTDGVVHAQTLLPANSVRELAIDETLVGGSSIAFTVEPQDSNTSMKIMLEVLCFLEDENE